MCAVPFYTRSVFFKEEMTSPFGEEKSADTRFCRWLGSICLHSNYGSKVIFHLKMPALSHSTTCTFRTRFSFRDDELQNNRMALVSE